MPVTDALVWVTTELGRAHLFTGFPWVLLGYSQTPVLAIAQLASVFGVYGVSALVAAVSAALALIGLGGSTSAPRHTYTTVAVMILLVFGIAVWGSVRVGRAELTRTGETMRVGLIQGNVDQAEKWDTARAAEIFADYLRLTRQAIREGAAMVFWFVAKFLIASERDLDPADYDLIGALGRLSTNIREGGTGEMIFSQQGSRRSIGARHDGVGAIPKGTEVVITRYEKGIAYVQRWDELTVGQVPDLPSAAGAPENPPPA